MRNFVTFWLLFGLSCLTTEAFGRFSSNYRTENGEKDFSFHAANHTLEGIESWKEVSLPLNDNIDQILSKRAVSEQDEHEGKDRENEEQQWSDGKFLKSDPLAGSHDDLKESVDEFFIVIMSILIFLMQAGFAFMEAGSVRSKNTVNILIKNLLDCLIGGIAYWLIGFPLAFGDGNEFMGMTYWASIGLPKSKLGHWFFDFVHAATAATLVSGSMAERCNFYAYLAYSFIITGFIYPVASHWVWAHEGWLFETPYQDYAGAGVVHMTGGAVAFIGTWLMGPRIGRFHKKTGEPLKIRGHSVPLTALGGFLLLFGFLAFVAGFQGHITQPGDGAIVSLAIMNALLGTCGGGIGALAIHRAGTFGIVKSWSFLMTLNGALAGMISVCAGANVFYPWMALLTGVIGGFVFLLCHFLLLRIKVDDPLDAFPVHFGGGLWALIAVALFQPNGIVFTGSHESAMVLAWNILGSAAIIAWAGGLCAILFGVMKYFNVLRVPEEMETRGLDVIKHNEPAYPAAAWLEGDVGSHAVSKMALGLATMIQGDNSVDGGSIHRSMTPRLSCFETSSYSGPMGNLTAQQPRDQGRRHSVLRVFGGESSLTGSLEDIQKYDALDASNNDIADVGGFSSMPRTNAGFSLDEEMDVGYRPRVHSMR